MLINKNNINSVQVWNRRVKRLILFVPYVQYDWVIVVGLNSYNII